MLQIQISIILGSGKGLLVGHLIAVWQARGKSQNPLRNLIVTARPVRYWKSVQLRHVKKHKNASNTQKIHSTRCC